MMRGENQETMFCFLFFFLSCNTLLFFEMRPPHVSSAAPTSPGFLWGKLTCPQNIDKRKTGTAGSASEYFLYLSERVSAACKTQSFAVSQHGAASSRFGCTYSNSAFWDFCISHGVAWRQTLYIQMYTKWKCHAFAASLLGCEAHQHNRWAARDGFEGIMYKRVEPFDVCLTAGLQLLLSFTLW